MTEHPAIASIIPRLEGLLGARVTGWRSAGGGYTAAIRLVCTTERGPFFAKAGATPLTAGFVRAETAFYRQVAAAGSAGAGFLPAFIASEDHEHHPLLVIEDLSGCTWPPPWTGHGVALVRAGIRAFHQQPIAVPPFAEVIREEPGWMEVSRDRRPFLGLGLVDERWLERALPRLLAAEAACVMTGDALCHFDIRSDNLCLAGNRAVFIDWNCACRGNPDLDIGFWLPSLAAEGGPAPETILPAAPAIAAWVSGYFAARAGRPIIPDAPRVRIVQLQQLRTALPWVARALELPPPAEAPGTAGTA